MSKIVSVSEGKIALYSTPNNNVYVDMEIVQNEGGRQVTRSADFYSLDAIEIEPFPVKGKLHLFDVDVKMSD